MKKILFVTLTTLLLMTAFSNVNASNSQPFQELWNAIYTLEDNYNTLFLEVEDHTIDITQLQNQINTLDNHIIELEERVSVLESDIPDGTPCDDSNTCTENDVYSSGICTGTPVAYGTECGEGMICSYEGECIPSACIDNDNDGYGDGCPAGVDCNDDDSAIYPGAEEICNDDLDNNCNGQVDEDCIS